MESFKDKLAQIRQEQELRDSTERRRKFEEFRRGVEEREAWMRDYVERNRLHHDLLYALRLQDFAKEIINSKLRYRTSRFFGIREGEFRGVTDGPDGGSSYSYDLRVGGILLSEAGRGDLFRRGTKYLLIGVAGYSDNYSDLSVGIGSDYASEGNRYDLIGMGAQILNGVKSTVVPYGAVNDVIGNPERISEIRGELEALIVDRVKY